MKGFILGVLLTFSLMTYQQSKPKVVPPAPAAPQQPAAKPDAIPAVPDVDKVKILSVMRAADKVQMELQGCQAHQWQSEFSQIGGELQKAVDTAFKDAGLSKDDYDLNTDTVAFVPKKAAAPKPEEKKN